MLKYFKYDKNIKSKKQFLNMDANAICSLTFALSAILGASRDKCCHKVFLYAIFGCIIFVMPSPNIPDNVIENIVIETIQKVFLTCSTGLLLGGSLLMSIQNDKKQLT